MSENIELNKKVYSKAAYDQIIDTDFNQLGIKPIQTQIDNKASNGFAIAMAIAL